MASNIRHAQDNQHAHKLRNVLSIASLSAAMSDDSGHAAGNSIRTRLLSSASGVALSVASVVVALGICAPSAAQAQTTVNPVQTTTFTLIPAQNPIIFGPTTNIDTSGSVSNAVDGDAGTVWTVTNDGTLRGGDNGVFLDRAGSSLTNSKSISGAGFSGVQFFNGGDVFNQVSGTISGQLFGINITKNVGTVTNAGTITALGSGSAGILFGGVGTVTNLAGGTISGSDGISIRTDAGTVNSVINAGTITGTGGTSVGFNGPGTNRLILQTGSVLNGDAVGSVLSTNNNLVLQGRGGADNNFVGFNSLEVQGGAAWTLNGNAEVGTATLLSGSTLTVGDSSHTGAVLTGDVTVTSGGVLSGVGKIAGNVDVMGGGRLAPGFAIGTLNVTGNVSFAPGSTFIITTAPTQHSQLAVGGTATLTGGAVQVLATGTGYAPSTQYTILTAAGGGLGGNNVFASITSDSPFLTPSLSYDANDVFLTLNLLNSCGAGGGLGFAGAAQTPNQRAVAGALDASPATNPLVIAVLNQTADGARQAFDALSGEVFGSVHNAQAGETQFARTAMLGRMRQASYAGAPGELGALAFGGPELAYAGGDANAAYAADIRSAVPVKAPMRTGERSRDLTFWAQGLGGWGRTDSDGNAASVTSRFGGFLSGVDAWFGDTARAGFVAGYQRSNLHVDARASSAGIDSVQIGAYAGSRLGALNVRGGASYSFDSIDTSRSIAFPGFIDQTHAKFHGHVGQVFGEVGYGMTFNHVAVEPLAGLAYVHVRDGAFLESGGAAALSGSSTHENIGYSFLGARAATMVPLANGTALVPRASVQWQHAFGDVTPVAGLAFQGTGTAFSVAGVPIARNTALIETGFDWRFSPQARLGAFYQGDLAAHAQTHAFKGVINWQF